MSDEVTKNGHRNAWLITGFAVLAVLLGYIAFQMTPKASPQAQQPTQRTTKSPALTSPVKSGVQGVIGLLEQDASYVQEKGQQIHVLSPDELKEFVDRGDIKAQNANLGLRYDSVTYIFSAMDDVNYRLVGWADESTFFAQAGNPDLPPISYRAWYYQVNGMNK